MSTPVSLATQYADPGLVIPMTKTELNDFMNEKDEQINFLEHENLTMVKQVVELRKQISATTEKRAGLTVSLSSLSKEEWDSNKKLQALQEPLKFETEKMEEVQFCLVRQVEETALLRNALVQTEKALEYSKHQWEVERACLLEEQTQEKASLEAALQQTKREKELERFQWEQEKISILESLRSTSQALDAQKKETNKHRGELTSRIQTLETQLKPFQKKNKMPVWRRLFWLFRNKSYTELSNNT